MKKIAAILIVFCMFIPGGSGIPRSAQAEAAGQGEAAEPGFFPVELSGEGGLCIMGISPDGASYLAYRDDFSSLGLIRNGIYTPFRRNESRGVPDTHSCLEYWERLTWLTGADDPVWSPDGRWLMITSYRECFQYNNPLFPVLLDTQTMEYFLLYDDEFEPGSFLSSVWFTGAVFSADSRQLYAAVYFPGFQHDVPFLWSWDLETGARSRMEIAFSEEIMEPFREKLADLYGGESWRDEGIYALSAFFMLYGPAGLQDDGSLVFCSDTDLARELNVPGSMFVVRLTVDGPDRCTVCELLPETIPDMIFYREELAAASAGQEIILCFYPAYGSTGASFCYTPFATMEQIRQGTCFVLDPVVQEPGSGELPFRIRQGNLQELCNPDSVDYTGFGVPFFVNDMVLSPDGKALLVCYSDRSGGVPATRLVHIRLADLSMTLLPVPEDAALPAPSNARTSGLSNSHLIWSDEGTILMTSGGNVYAFRTEPAAAGVK